MAVRRNKILVVTRNFPPLTGGMERLNHQVFLALNQQYDVMLCGPEGCKEFVDNAACYEFPASPPWKYMLGSLLSTIRAAFFFKPDLVYAGSGLAAPAALIAAKIAGTPCAVFLHGLDLISDNKIYQRIFLPAIKQCDLFFANSQHTAKLAGERGIPSNRITVIHPGVELPDISLREKRGAALRTRLKLGNRPLLLSAGRLTPRKGIVEFIDRCMPDIVRAHSSVCLLIIGDAPTQGFGKNAINLKKQIHEAINRNELQENVKLLGRSDDKTLSDAYFSASAFVFPVIDIPGDVEGFGMVAIEAAAHGTFTIAFASGGIPDAVADGVSGKLVPSGNYLELSRVIIHQLDSQSPDQTTFCRQYAEPFSWHNFGKTIRTQCGMALLQGKNRHG